VIKLSDGEAASVQRNRGGVGGDVRCYGGVVGEELFTIPLLAH